MDDTDLIARVYPCSDDQEDLALGSIEGSPFCVEPLHRRLREEVQYGRDDRETTEPPEEPVNKNNPKYEGRPFIEGPSNYHFSLTFDKQNRFIVRDLGSRMGTEVTYNNKGKGIRRKFNWIVGGDSNAYRQQNTIIKIHDDIQFQVVAAKHDIQSSSYIENVKNFRQGSATAEGLADLAISQSDTEPPTEAPTPGEGSIYLQRKIGKGGFGVAIHCWNVSTGKESVIKRPTLEFIKKVAKHDKTWKRWQEEAENMQGLTHKHIVELLGAKLPDVKLHNVKLPSVKLPNLTDDAYPELELEYIPGGPLSKLKNIKVPECVHSTARRYSASVDIWSLGVVMCKILGILPSYSQHMQHVEQNVTQISWCNMVVDSLGQIYRRRPDSLKIFLLLAMLVIDPESRGSAQHCHRVVQGLPDLIVNNDRISDVLWRRASIVYSDDTTADGQSTIRPGEAAVAHAGADAGYTDNDEQSTDGTNSTESSYIDDETRRRSAAPPPPSHQVENRSTLKRPTGEIAPESPNLKRRGRMSTSQSHSYPAMLDTQVDQETAAAAALLADLKNR